MERFSEDIQQAFKGKRVLVTGGTGLIGRAVCQQLLELGALVTSVSMDQIQLPFAAYGDSPGCTQVQGDLRDLGFCLRITKSMDTVFHVAGIKGSIEVTQSRPASFLVNLLMMNTNLLESCRRNQVGRVLYTSSIGAYASAEEFIESEEWDEGAPMDAFPGWAKRMGELQIKAYGIEYGIRSYSAVRICNVYGPGDNFDPGNAMVIPSLLSRLRRGEDPLLVWGDGSAIRDFAYSEDVAEGVIRAAFYGTDGKYINLGSGIGVSIRQVVETLQSFILFRAEFDASKPAGFPKRVMNIRRARDRLGFDPKTSLREGLMKTWQWYQENPDESSLKQNYFSDKGPL